MAPCGPPLDPPLEPEDKSIKSLYAASLPLITAVEGEREGGR